MSRRFQKNITITKEQEAYVRENYGKMSNAGLAKMLGLPYNKTLNNLKVMGLHIPEETTQRHYHCVRVIDMETYFDVDTFGKYYNY